jgi:hypothetical protein
MSEVTEIQTADFADSSPKIASVNIESSSSASTEDQLRGYALFLDKLKDPSCSQLVSRVKLFVSRFPSTLNRAQASERLHQYAIFLSLSNVLVVSYPSLKTIYRRLKYLVMKQMKII